MVGVAEGYSPATARRSRRHGRRLLATLLTVAVVVAALGWTGNLPAWVPYSEALTRQEPVGPDVDYPVYGSDELVEYLARSMVAQEEAIDVSYWVQAGGRSYDDITAAVLEAGTQNPYVFVSEWSQTISLVNPYVRPTYTYDATEAERRRSETKVAVTTALDATGAATAASDQDKAALINDYIAAHATYDVESFEAVERDPDGAPDGQAAQSQEAYGILVAGTAVCNGYAKAFQLLADAAGLESVIVTGEADGGVYSGPHAWNRVNVDGTWLVVDTTWNDTDTAAPGRGYFLLEDGDPMLETRTVGDGWVLDANRADYA
jgi:hypothetical protein